MSNIKVQWKKQFEKHNPGKLYIANEHLAEDYVGYAFVDLSNERTPVCGIAIYHILGFDDKYWDNQVACLMNSSWGDARKWVKNNKA